ncbi:MAG: hypothetical protein IPK69_06620 [Phycisphaerales bacterium]|nr:MAG: hypothetical protein IPK69_06620 [Phycisphaerales bacterium]
MPSDSRRLSLDQLSVAAPCPARWDDMEGTETKRFCAECGLHVHNVSAMTADEAAAFLAAAVEGKSHGERVCVRLFKRADGTVITRNCPIGLAAIRHRAWANGRRVAAAIIVGITGLFVADRAHADGKLRAQTRWPAMISCRALKPFSWISAKLGKTTIPQPGLPMMGDIAFVPPPTDVAAHARDLAGIPQPPQAPQPAPTSSGSSCATTEVDQ